MNKSAVNGKALKAQEESNLKLLRELSHIAGNRHCFDCGQRGPTYVNVTIGSFICMSCSGLLRGLTPPHRVKSISMASFTADEIELLKTRGNDYCRKVWLATCTSRDSNVGSEKDPDRLNVLRTFMSAKYEQKRFYVDPSKLPQSELNEIQAQTAKALSSSSSSISNSSGSTMQKSPSLSSASSASSLSLHNQNNPSPVLNNSRNAHINSQNRLVNSITLPDIKPLSSLLGPVNVTTSVGSANQSNGSKSNNLAAGSLGLTNGKSTSTPVPINFINNLSSSQQQHKSSGLLNGTSMCNNDPWEGDNNNFHANFADFDAFNSNSKNGGGGNDVNDLNMSNFANFDAFQQPLLPANNSTGMDLNSVKSDQSHPLGGTAEDKYAALKDLDNIFKQGINGEPTNHGLSSSVSFPTNLSSSSSGAAALFSSSPNQQQGMSSSNASGNSGWTVNGTNGPNPHNPFFNNTTPSPWQSNSSATSSSLFSSSPGGCFQTSGLSQHSNGGPNQTGMLNGISNSALFGASSNGGFPSQMPSASFTKPANPFFSTMPASSVNPNNPFL